MSNHDRVKQMKTGSPKTSLFSKSRVRSDVPQEHDMIAELAILAAGLQPPA